METAESLEQAYDINLALSAASPDAAPPKQSIKR